MSTELDILKLIADNPHTSQRKISEYAGISLGQVNFLIKKFVKKGIIKLEGQSSKSIRYNLTPKGMALKGKLTLEYIKISYGAVISLTNKIRDLAEKYERMNKKIYIYGSQDEMMDICKLALGNRAEYINCNEGLFDIEADYIIFYWDGNNFTIPTTTAVNILQ